MSALDAFFEARDRWADSRRVLRDKAVAERTPFPATQDIDKVARRWAKTPGIIIIRRDKTYGTVSPEGHGLKLSGLAEVMSLAVDDFMERAARLTDEEMARWAFGVWRDWPFRSGFSRSQLDVIWIQDGDNLISRFVSRAPYTFVAKRTSKAFQKARRSLPGLAAKIGTRLEAGQ